ncbi:hypothetical protein K7X08_013905 [Anisodus acutangulus]|uniref:Uncharacterized protein n=1 Tax=Anisodus acutangulus TaxID=402998 RepID=A0A9Q1LPD0_9SOLA|nr:hypothetical protein K7X08_013905 [Anisodus acutangulus]
MELQESNSRMLSTFSHMGSVLQLESTNFTEDSVALDCVTESEVLLVAPIITYSEVEFDLGIVSFNSQTDFERPRVAFDQMPESNGLSRYGMMPKNVTAQHRLLHFPFDLGSANGLIFEGVALVFEDSILWNLQYSMFEALSRNAAFPLRILNLRYGHYFAMYHYDTGQTPSLMTLPGADQSWLKCLDNESTTVGVFVTVLTSAIEAGQSNLADQMLNEMPPSCSKVFDPGPSFATIILADIDSGFDEGKSVADPTNITSVLAFDSNAKKLADQDDAASSSSDAGVIIAPRDENSDINLHKDVRKMFAEIPDREAAIEVEEFPSLQFIPFLPPSMQWIVISVPDVWLRALAFLRHLSTCCPVRLRFYWAAILDTMTKYWKIGKFAIKVLKEIASVVLTAITCLAQLLHLDLVQNSVVTLRNIAGNGLELVFYHIEQFMQVWCTTRSMILEDIKKEDAFAPEFVLKLEEYVSLSDSILVSLFMLLYLNLEDKVLFEGRRNVINGELANYIWDSG